MESSYFYIGYGLALLNYCHVLGFKVHGIADHTLEPSPNAVSHIGDERLLALPNV